MSCRIPRAAFHFALVLLFVGIGCTPKPPEHGTSFLIEFDLKALPPSEQSAVVSRAEAALAKRMDLLGTRAFFEPAGSNRILLKMAQLSDESLQHVRKSLQRSANLEFRLVHPETTQLLQQGLVPVGYELKKEVRQNADGTRAIVPFLVSKIRITNVSGVNIKQATVIRGNADDPQIAFNFDTPGAAAFADLTRQNVGRQLAILIDGELFSAPVIRTPITEGNGVISGGNMTRSDAFALAADLCTSLAVPAKIVEERNF